MKLCVLCHLSQNKEENLKAAQPQRKKLISKAHYYTLYSKKHISKPHYINILEKICLVMALTLCLAYVLKVVIKRLNILTSSSLKKRLWQVASVAKVGLVSTIFKATFCSIVWMLSGHTKLCSLSWQKSKAFPTSLRFWKHTVFSSAYSTMSFNWWWKNSRIPAFSRQHHSFTVMTATFWLF